MSFPKWPAFKDPDEVLDFLIDWTLRLAGDQIITSQWLPPTPSGLTVNSNSFTASKTTIWFSGGISGTKYQITNRITTLGARTQDQTMILQMKDK